MSLPNIDYWNRAIFDPDLENDWSATDKRLWLPTDDEVQRLARTINASHRGQHNETKAWPADFREVGLYGERAMCRVFNAPMDTAVRRYGSGRANVILNDGTRVDVMARRVLRNRQLPDLTRRVKGHRKLADVVVLVVWVGRGWEPVFLGWLRDEEVAERGEVRSFQNGNPNYVVPASSLNSMFYLMERHDPASPLAGTDSMHEPEQPVMDTGPQQSMLLGGNA